MAAYEKWAKSLKIPMTKVHFTKPATLRKVNSFSGILEEFQLYCKVSLTK